MAEQRRKDGRTSRELFQFWLDGAKPDMKTAIKQFNRWRSHRKLTSWILDMWRLWESLAAGETDILFSMFPNIREKLDPTPVMPDTNELIEQFRQMIKAEVHALPLQSPAAPVGMTGQALTQQAFAMPTFDEDDAVVLKKDTRTDSASSFLEAALGLKAAENQQG